MTDLDEEDRRRMRYEPSDLRDEIEEKYPSMKEERLAHFYQCGLRLHAWELRKLEEEKYPFLKEERLAKATERVETERQKAALELVRRVEAALDRILLLGVIAFAFAVVVAVVIFVMWLRYR
jgi:hypothetical protein